MGCGMIRGHDAAKDHTFYGMTLGDVSRVSGSAKATLRIAAGPKDGQIPDQPLTCSLFLETFWIFKYISSLHGVNPLF